MKPIITYFFLIFSCVAEPITYLGKQSEDLSNTKNSGDLWKVELETSVTISETPELKLTTYEYKKEFVIRLTDGAAKFGKSNILIQNGGSIIQVPRISISLNKKDVNKFDKNYKELTKFSHENKNYILFVKYNTISKKLDVKIEESS